MSRDIALHFLGPSALDGVGGQPHAPAASTPGKDPVHILQEAGWAPGPVWTGGKFRPHRDSIPDHPARSSVAIPTELPDPLIVIYIFVVVAKYPSISACGRKWYISDHKKHSQCICCELDHNLRTVSRFIFLCQKCPWVRREIIPGVNEGERLPVLKGPLDDAGP